MLRCWLGQFSLKAKTVNNILIPLRAIIDQALADGLIDQNPLTPYQII